MTSASPDIFSLPISTAAPPAMFHRQNHAVTPQGCSIGAPIQTNNFSNNLTLDDQLCPVWTQPYSLWYAQDPDLDVGLAFNHTTAQQRVFGPDSAANPVQFYFNPPRIKSFVLSGEGFQGNVALRLENHHKMSVMVKIVLGNDENKSLLAPLVQGMGFITAIYNNIVPVVVSPVGVASFTEQVAPPGLTKYRVQLFNQVVWSMYVVGSVSFALRDPNHIVASGIAQGVTVQFCSGESQYYDQTAGCYPVECHTSATLTHNDRCVYSFNYLLQGRSVSQASLVWAFPHHVEAATEETTRAKVALTLDSTTKGPMSAFITSQLSMEEALPVSIGMEPWSAIPGFTGATYSEQALAKIRAAAEKDVAQDVVTMANIDSMYTSGKILDRFAYILYVCHYVLKDSSLTSQLLPKLKQAAEIFSTNHQQFPLAYDETWKGLVSSAEPGADFGNANYNDHHFHYGYHIHAFALIGTVDRDLGGAWTSCVNDYITTMLRDVANPSEADVHFPVSRSFDFFHGHSFAHGIFALGDGKDEESSSEDYHFAYGMKLWAQLVGDANMEARANLMLSILRRSMNMHMLFSDDNTVQPANFIKNKCAGITFENKVDFSTYFGRGSIENEWIHGIHMLPTTPVSSYVRGPTFVKEEWDQILGRIIDRIDDGWRGILMLNYACCNPRAAYAFFAGDSFEQRWLDNGQSLTWCLTYCAGVGGA
ncbi:glycoside hydrolase family 81 protein [Babjeviella inositovora NRRL Y-12698]|uniref:glucan endo-1,3-beta-D-glucosidase n=1 Tax=Babjeviella inositovora NRRL Y-12698 TaxID=984486 RepID=A0A1E3QX66_9ASCO|nr:glycoside hydrolase family 81 protein [Babjeviella inositovora NRRL Y-12698]ODQ82114.1 glycoside hydrolase family 81 protein [Babjeviella inositovora NRRL Y-12698]